MRDPSSVPHSLKAAHQILAVNKSHQSSERRNRSPQKGVVSEGLHRPHYCRTYADSIRDSGARSSSLDSQLSSAI